MKDWDPALYTRFEDERTRPARDLLARVPLQKAALAFDLGCGPGNSTELLVQRFAQAEIHGTDNSESMLASERQRLPGVRFELSDIAHWQPERAPDLIYANAALQWVGDHASLVPRLFKALAPGGVLAIQMPDNRDEPSHRAMREVAAAAPFAQAIGDVTALRTAVLGIADYYDMLSPVAAQVDVWHTIYQHPLDSAAAIVEWVRATGLKPFVEKLPAHLHAEYLAQYQARIERWYPPRADGKRLLAFPRMFIVAQRKP